MLIALFAGAQRLVRETVREIVLVLEHEGRAYGVTADSVESVEYLDAETIQPIVGLPGLSDTSLVCRTGRTVKQDRLVMLIEADRLARELAGSVPAAA